MSSVPIACFFFFPAFTLLVSFYLAEFPPLFSLCCSFTFISDLFFPTIFFISFACIYLYSLLHLCFYSSFFWSTITFSFLSPFYSVSHFLYPPSLHFLESIFLKKLLPFLIAEYCFFLISHFYYSPVVHFLCTEWDLLINKF